VPEAEESPLSQTVALESLVKMQAGKGLAKAVVICELWRFLVVPSHVYKWPISPFTNPTPVYSHP
jgi:hypothetical protein